MNLPQLSELVARFVVLAQNSPEDHIRADKGLSSRLNAWSATNSVKMVDMGVQGKRIHEIKFDNKHDVPKEKSFRASFETEILAKAGGFSGWISLRFPISE